MPDNSTTSAWKKKQKLQVKNTYLSNQASKPKSDFTIVFVSAKPLQKDLN
jgi:hypothetical protein